MERFIQNHFAASPPLSISDGSAPAVSWWIPLSQSDVPTDVLAELLTSFVSASLTSSGLAMSG